MVDQQLTAGVSLYSTRGRQNVLSGNMTNKETVSAGAPASSGDASAVIAVIFASLGTRSLP